MPAAARRVAIDFARLAASYDRHRPCDANWWQLFAQSLRTGDLAGRRVLEVGCGSGAFAAALADVAAAVTAVDPCPEMLAVARGRLEERARLERAPAERLPFPERSFERAVMRLVVQELDRPAAFREVARVLASAGRLVIVTSDRDSLDALWVNRIFPSLAAIDCARFPTREALAGELRDAGFERPAVWTVRQRASVTRELALARIRGRHVSTLQLLDDCEYRAGLARAERALPDRLEYPLVYELVVAAKVG